MYNCQVCGKTVPAGVRCFVITAATKEVVHPYRPKAHRIRIDDKWEMIDDPGGRGLQIKRELRACPDCQHYSPMLSEGLSDVPTKSASFKRPAKQGSF